MILDSITLKNLGVYAGRQEVILTPPDRARPIILFGGLNGGGKTTFLDAVQLAFYGPKARVAGRGKLAYKDYLREMIHRGADPYEGAAISIKFRRTMDGQVVNFQVTRSWCEGVKGLEEKVIVERDGGYDPLLSEHWDEFIEGYIPSGIAHLFFFDAEQIKELAEGDHAAEILGTAVQTLLGLDLVDRLESDLKILEQRKRKEAKTGEAADRLAKAKAEVDRLDQAIQSALQEEGRLGNEAGRLVKALGEAEDRFRRDGGDLYLVRAEMDRERARLEEAKAREENILRELAAGPAPLLMISDLLAEAEEQARKEDEVKRAKVVLSVLEDRDRDLLARIELQKFPPKQKDFVANLLEQDRAERQLTLAHPCYLHAEETLATEIRHLRQSILPETKQRIASHLTLLEDWREKLARQESEIGRIPAEDVIQSLVDEVEAARRDHARACAALEAQQELIQSLTRQFGEAQKAYARELGEDVAGQIAGEHGERVLNSAARVRATLTRLRSAVIQKHAARLESLVLEAFRQLLRKTSLVSGLRIVPVEDDASRTNGTGLKATGFRIELVGGDGSPLPFERLSSGERQLLATSLLWGLAKASGRPLPTIIDTPLGRLDSSHRQHLVERYFPVASHQVILLSTDEEIDQDSLNSLAPSIGRSYHLQFDDAKRHTTITQGYFWNHETTR